MAKICLTIDGKRIETEPGRRLLDVARENGIDIPTLCHDPRLEPFGSCRLCLVEAAGAKGPIAACGSVAADGVTVTTNSEPIRNLRKMALELLVSNHHGDCVAPCSLACPAGIDIQGYTALIADGCHADALQLIKQRMPLPAICGRVCPKFCETACRRNVVDEPVAICWLKRFAADADLGGEPWLPEVADSTGRRVAVIGGGPTGLTAAYYLAIAGHSVTIFERSPELGGMMRYGIPAYRLPRDILDAEIRTITRLCQDVRVNSVLGRDFTLDSLRADGFDAVFAAIGAQGNQDMKTPGEDLEGVLPGVSFLRAIASGEDVRVGKRVCVVGGGNTAMDAARNALRRGAERVTVIYRRSEQEMPASDEEVEQAKEEGIEFMLLTNPVEFLGCDGRLTSVRCVRMELGEPDASGRRRPVAVAGSEFDVPADNVVIAIGQKVVADGLEGIKLDRYGCVAAGQTYQTCIDWLFAAGDCVTGPKTVVEAVGAARKAALAIDAYLNGRPVVPEPVEYNASRGELDEIDPAEYDKQPRIARASMPMRPAAERRTDYAEIETGFDEQTAVAESGRCLECGCLDLFECDLRRLATEYGVTERFGPGRFVRPLPADHSYIIRDPHKCILCGSCVRICSEVQDVAALGFVHRAFETEVMPALELPLEETLCETCGQCVSACPTGALSARTFVAKPGPFVETVVPTTCPNCGLGCELELRVAADRIIRVTTPVDGDVSHGSLCKQGAFGFRFALSPQRLTEPMVRDGDRLRPASWEEAITRAASGLRLAAERDSVAVLGSSKLTVEEAYTAGRLARTALNTNNVDSLTPINNGGAVLECTFDEMESSDLVLVYGADLATTHPVLASRVRSAAANGTSLVVISPFRTRLDKLARATVGVNSRRAPQLLELMLDYILRYDLIDREFVAERTSGIDELRERVGSESMARLTQRLWTKPEKVIEILHLYLRAKNPVIIVDADAVSEVELGLLVDLAAVCGNMGRPGAGIIAVRSSGNVRGSELAGMRPGSLPGGRPLADDRVSAVWGRPTSSRPGLQTKEVVAAVRSGMLGGLLIVDCDDPAQTTYPVGEQTFTVIMTPSLTSQVSHADVVLPASTFAEAEGTLINDEGRRRVVNRAIPAPSGRDNIRVLAELADALGCPLPWDTAAEAAAELSVLESQQSTGPITLFTDIPTVGEAAGD